MSYLKIKKLTDRTLVSTGKKWEDVVGYSRAVLIGNKIAVTGTIGIRPDNTIPESATEQMEVACRIVVDSLKALGADAESVYRTRIYVTDIDQWEEIGAVHNQFFGKTRPATTMVEVTRLAAPEALLEIEADAVLKV